MQYFFFAGMPCIHLRTMNTMNSMKTIKKC